MRLPVWDAPLRLFHWTLAVLVTFSFVTGKVGGDWMAWHMRSGYAILTLLAFRIGWGFFGGETARFSRFLRGPATAARYVRDLVARRYPGGIGHNPLGGWAVLAMLAIVLTQAISGLFVDDEISNQGPLAVKAPGAIVTRMSAIHDFNQWLVLAIALLHVAAIATYWKLLRRNLVSPMVTGEAEVPAGTAPPSMGSRIAALAWLLLCAAGVYLLVVVYPAAR